MTGNVSYYVILGLVLLAALGLGRMLATRAGHAGSRNRYDRLISAAVLGYLVLSLGLEFLANR